MGLKSVYTPVFLYFVFSGFHGVSEPSFELSSAFASATFLNRAVLPARQLLKSAVSAEDLENIQIN